MQGGDMMGQFPICNHKKETAPKLFGKAFPLCWRCSGVFLAFQVMGILNLIGAVKYPAPRGGVFDPRGIRQISAQARLLGSLLAGINRRGNYPHVCLMQQHIHLLHIILLDACTPAFGMAVFTSHTSSNLLLANIHYVNLMPAKLSPLLKCGDHFLVLPSRRGLPFNTRIRLLSSLILMVT